jgi:tetrapyrrole methylase family protein/MazG family protein
MNKNFKNMSIGAIASVIAGAYYLYGSKDGLAKKLVRRHPHVFGSMKLATARQVAARWDDIKKRERALKKQDRLRLRRP